MHVNEESKEYKDDTIEHIVEKREVKRLLDKK